MAVHETQMLLLGGVAMFEPANGYQIRRELISWQVDRWAHVNPGSIYHGLASLTRQGLLRRTDLVDGTREVAVYEMTDQGRTELRSMLVEALETVDPYDRVGLHVAFAMLPLLGRDQVATSLTTRRVALEATVAELVEGQDLQANGPPHARRGWVLWRDIAIAELAWLREVIADVVSGELKFAPDEDWDWAPPADDPGWQMVAEREKYRALLGR